MTAAAQQLEGALKALSFSVQKATEDEGVVVDPELSDILVDLDIVPGKQPSTSAFEAAEIWAGLEEQADVAKAIMQDEQERLLDVTCIADDGGSDGSESDDEVEMLGAAMTSTDKAAIAGTSAVQRPRRVVWFSRG